MLPLEDLYNILTKPVHKSNLKTIKNNHIFERKTLYLKDLFLFEVFLLIIVNFPINLDLFIIDNEY